MVPFIELNRIVYESTNDQHNLYTHSHLLEKSTSCVADNCMQFFAAQIKTLPTVWRLFIRQRTSCFMPAAAIYRLPSWLVRYGGLSEGRRGADPQIGRHPLGRVGALIRRPQKGCALSGAVGRVTATGGLLTPPLPHVQC